MFTKHAFSQQPSNDELNILGRRAAKRHLEDGQSLTDAVAELVKEGNLDRTQISHVARTANQATWNTLHREEGDREAEFDPANPDDVLDKLSIPRERAVEAVHDYYGDPPGEESREDLDVSAIFGEPGEKIAHLLPDTERLNQLDREARLRDDAAHAQRRVEPILWEAHENFFQEVKKTYLDDGVPLTKISQVVAEVIDEPRFVVNLMTAVSNRLEGEGVTFDIVKEAQAARPQSEVHVIVIEHPLVKAASALQEAVLSHAAATAAFTSWNNEYQQRWRGRR